MWEYCMIRKDLLCFSDVINYTAHIMPIVAIFILLEGIGVSMA